MIKIGLWGSQPYIDLPYHVIGWLGWLAMAAVILWSIRKSGLSKNSSITKNQRLLFVVLLALTFATNLFVGLTLPGEKILPLPNVPRESTTPILMVFSALPWLLAGGMLGPVSTAILAFVGGCISAFWNTHSPFTPLETTSIALLACWALRQNYRTAFFRLVRHPLGSALFVAVISTPIYLFSTFFATSGPLAAKLDYAFTQSWSLMIINGLQLIIAGFLLEIFLVMRSRLWIQIKTFQPSPSEAGLQTRILYVTLPMILVLLLTLTVADWTVAGNAARQMVENQLASSARAASENIPYFIETGQSLALDLATANLTADETDLVNKTLQNKIRSVPYFNELFVFDKGANPVTGYPSTDANQLQLSDEEKAGLQLALNGVRIQTYLVAPADGSDSAQVSFIAAIPDEYGMADGILLARTDLATNFFSQPALSAIEEIKNSGGEGVILDVNNRVLYHTLPGLVMTTYNGEIPEATGFYDETSATGTRRLLYAVITSDGNWKILLSVPATTAQEIALRIAVPLLAMTLVVSLAAYVLLRFMMKKITVSLGVLADRADEIAHGSLDTPIETSGVDEIGRLGAAFEQMRKSMKDRLEELDHLLKVSQGVASNLTISGSASHILEAVLTNGACSGRLVLLKEPNILDVPADYLSYSAGKCADEYSALDEMMLGLLKEEQITIIPSKSRIKRMGISKTASLPAAVAGVAIREEDTYYGVLWIAYDQTHRFQDTEIRFINTIAGQVVLAVANSNLYQRAEIGKKRLESVLESTPEPVILVGENQELILANPAARAVSGLIGTSQEMLFEKEKILSGELVKFLSLEKTGDEGSKEITLENGRTYFASISNVDVEQSKVGRVCVLRDVTDYKALEKMKSEFVTTVSHDLRSPLSLVKGYTSMLQMVGELNDQQKDYTAKIVNGLETMNHMVDNLLDLGRIEAGIDLQLEKVKPYDLLEQVMSMLQPQATQRKIQLMRELSNAQEIEIDADRVLLQQALFNLLDNAIKYSSLNSQVNLRLIGKDASVVFSVQDHGAGIAPLDLPFIFDRMYKPARKDGNTQKGSGLGLSIVKSVAERHKGKAWAESTLGKGSTFSIEIPIRQPENRTEIKI